jgi:photosystem II stability/assembly factor-like uncharacterized protein
MKKIAILILAIPLLAASCDIFSVGGGTRGIFKSEDNGETYHSSSAVDKKNDISNLSIQAMVSDPSNPDILYVGVNGGIYKTENGAQSWKLILSGINVASIAVDRFAPSTIYAGGMSGSSGKIIKSVDFGSSWTDMYTEPSKENPVLSVAVSSVSGSTVMAGLANGELIRSTDAGHTWQLMRDFSDRISKIKFGSSSVAYILTQKQGLYKSTDLGVTWQYLTSTLTAESINSTNVNGAATSGFHDLGLDLKQNGVLYLGSDTGLYRSVNDGKDWAFLSLPVRDAALRVSAVSVSADNSNLLYASVAATMYKSVNGGLTWETHALPSSAYINTIVINPLSTNIIYLGLRS